MSGCVHLMSGGLDSTVLLYDLCQQIPGEVSCLLFDYGQRHSKELEYAEKTCGKLAVPHQRVVLPSRLFAGSALTGGMHAMEGTPTVVPNRNMVMLSLAVAHATVLGSWSVSWAANKDDAEIYPDCRPAFLDAMNHAVGAGNNRPVTVRAPYILMTKKEVVALGRKLGVPFGETWSCYAGGLAPCGVCGACKVRKDALCA